MILKLKDGDVKIELFEDVAPNHVKRIKDFANAGKYDNVVFHRVIDGFMAQTGDVKFGNQILKDFNLRMAGMGGSDLPNLKQEFNSLPHDRGTLSMARSSDPDSANSQFFICFKPAPFLDRQYTVFGKVIEGMEYVDKIKRGDENNNGAVSDPDKIISFKSLIIYLMALKKFAFKILDKDKYARNGIIETHRGKIHTPAFMPVGTQATVKACTINDIKKTGSEIILGNTYHLMIRPGVERIQRVGGLHEFMNCDLPILTDSGGFQVMSLSKLNKIDREKGAIFNSHVDGKKFYLSPEESIRIQLGLNSDIVMIMDECPKKTD